MSKNYAFQIRCQKLWQHHVSPWGSLEFEVTEIAPAPDTSAVHGLMVKYWLLFQDDYDYTLLLCTLVSNIDCKIVWYINVVVFIAIASMLIISCITYIVAIIYVITIVIYCYYHYRRKFRSQTSDNMQRWKSRGGKSQRGEVKKWEDQRGRKSEERRCRCAKK